MKWYSLLKAILTQDMNIFRYRTKSNSKLSKISVPFLMFFIVSFCIGIYAYNLAKILAPHNLTYITLTIFLGATTILTYMEGIYKSMTIVFDSKDNDLLLSLPIKNTTILFVRIFKLVLYQYIFNLMYILPAYIVYCFIEKPSISFYPISLIMILLIPLIPTVIACLIGLMAKVLFNKMKKNKIMQTVFSLAFFLVILYYSFNNNGMTESIIPTLIKFHDAIIKYYYPIGLYMNLINNATLIGTIKLILVNILPFGLFIFMLSLYYFKILSRSKNMSITTNNKEIKIKSQKPVISLAIKEIKKYLFSPVYMMNTLFGLILIIIITFILVIKGEEAVLSLFTNSLKGISSNLLFYFLIVVFGGFTTISSSSISFEGKTINITKSLPISIKDIFNSKILYCYIIELPFMLISLLIYTIFYKPKLLVFIALLSIILLIIFITAVIGLIINLKYPKLNYTNDTEVVKQSLSVILSLFLGIGVIVFSIVLVLLVSMLSSIKTAIFIHLLAMILLSAILYILLIKKGTKRYKQLNI